MKRIVLTLLLLVLLSTQVYAASSATFSVFIIVSNVTATTTTTTTTSTTTTTTTSSTTTTLYKEDAGFVPMNVTSKVEVTRVQLATVTPITEIPIVGPVIKSGTDNLLDWLQQDAWTTQKAVPVLGSVTIKNWMFMSIAITFILIFTRKEEHGSISYMPF